MYKEEAVASSYKVDGGKGDSIIILILRDLGCDVNSSHEHKNRILGFKKIEPDKGCASFISLPN